MSDVRVDMNQVFKAVQYANDHPHRYLSGTTNWCAAVAFELNRQIVDAQPSDGAITNEGAGPVAWRNFDGEGNYDYTDDEETAQSWIAYNGPKYHDWRQELFLGPPAPASVVLTERQTRFLRRLGNHRPPHKHAVP